MDQLNDPRLYHYIEVLEHKAEAYGLSLRRAFTNAGFPTSTAWRAMTKKTHVSYDVAFKVNAELEEMLALKNHRDKLRSLQSDD